MSEREKKSPPIKINLANLGRGGTLAARERAKEGAQEDGWVEGRPGGSDVDALVNSLFNPSRRNRLDPRPVVNITLRAGAGVRPAPPRLNFHSTIQTRCSILYPCGRRIYAASFRDP